MGRRGSSATRSSSGSGSRRAITIRWSATGIAELIGGHTRAILLESPGSLTMEVQDVPAICDSRARARDRHAARQYLGDAAAVSRRSPAGVDITHPRGDQICRWACRRHDGRRDRDRRITIALQTAAWDLGHAVSPDDAWLGSRGLRTMAVRLKQHEGSALKIARVAQAAAGGGRRAPPRPPRLSRPRNLEA